MVMCGFQLYVHAESRAVPRPPQELRAFTKRELGGHHRARIEFELTPRAFAHWDEAAGDWRIQPGRYEIRIGASSRDIRSGAWIELTE